MLDMREANLMPKSEVIAVLRRHDISPTQQRVEIAQILLSRHQHMSAEQVLEAVNVEKAKVSKATVYNTLGLFARKGLVNELIIDPTKVFYDSNIVQHHHFYNLDTGELMDISEEDVDVARLPQLPEGTTTAGVEVIVRLKKAS